MKSALMPIHPIPDAALAQHMAILGKTGSGKSYATRGIVERLLGRVRAGAAGAETYVGLVVACRFCGLLEASRAAHDEARRRDPKVRTSVHYTLFLLGELEQALAEDEDEAPAVRLSAHQAMREGAQEPSSKRL